MPEPNNTPMMPNNMPSPDNMPRMQDNCVPQETVIKNVQLANAYVPIQKLCRTFTPIQGLKHGTIFPPLTGMAPWEKSKTGEFDDE